ncbi:MAG TPA: glutamate--tRNA ligase, partial [Kaistiaceae bacterium]|nr:glutamate--tRNA ligase [Kaistiaceae bacterium]
YLPAAMRNYLARLGWSHGDDEIFSTDEMIEWFTLEGIGKSAARFDFAKLENLNGHYMRATDDATLMAAFLATLPHLEGGPALAERLDDAGRGRIEALLPGLKERAKTLLDLLDGVQFLVASRPLAFDEKAAKILADGGAEVLKALLPHLEKVAEWTVEATDEAVRTFAEAEGLKLGKVAQPLRAALTGRSTSPGIFEVLAVLGKDESLGRIRDSAAA